MADLVVELGAAVVVVTAVEATADEESSEEESSDELPVELVVSCPEMLDDVAPLPVVVDVFEFTGEAVVPGISLDTTKPMTAAAAVAAMTTELAVRRTLVVAMSRRLAPSCAGRRWGRSGNRVEGSGGEVMGGSLMSGMAPCEPRDPRTAG